MDIAPQSYDSPDRTKAARKGSAPRLPADIIAAVALVASLLGLLAFFTHSNAKKEKASKVEAAARTGATAATPVGFDIFRHPQSNPQEGLPLKDDDTVHATDGFTFTLHNRTGQATRFMLFAMDAGDTLYWFFPQSDLQKRNLSPLLGAVENAVIPEGVTPSGMKPGVLRIAGFFSDEPLTVLDVEDGLRQHGPQGLAEALHGTLQVITLQLAS